MFKEQMGSFARTFLAAGSGISLGILVERFDITPETLEAILRILEQTAGSLQGFLSLLGILIAQGWSLHQKMQKSRKNNGLTIRGGYND